MGDFEQIEIPDVEDDFDQTLTVTISLDDDDTRSNDLIPLDGGSNFFDIEQPTASKYLMSVDEEILIWQLPHAIRRTLELRLNPPELGTMRNWEFIFAQLGLSLDEISMIRKQNNPVEQVLHIFSQTPFNALLLQIADVNRIDVLISLRPHLRNIKESLVKMPPQANKLPSLNHISLPSTSNQNIQLKPLPKKFLLITHHEPPRVRRRNDQQMDRTMDSAIDVSTDDSVQQQLPDNNDETANKRFKYFWKNLKTWGKTAGIDVLDIDNCIDESNILASIEQHFNEARQIVLVASEAYRKDICGKDMTTNPKVDIKRKLHQLMNNEYSNHGNVNFRFRVIVLCVQDKVNLPLGWASSTITYTFPENHIDIVKRLFEDNK